MICLSHSGAIRQYRLPHGISEAKYDSGLRVNVSEPTMVNIAYPDPTNSTIPGMPLMTLEPNQLFASGRQRLARPKTKLDLTPPLGLQVTSLALMSITLASQCLYKMPRISIYSILTPHNLQLHRYQPVRDQRSRLPYRFHRFHRLFSRANIKSVFLIYLHLAIPALPPALTAFHLALFKTTNLHPSCSQQQMCGIVAIVKPPTSSQTL